LDSNSAEKLVSVSEEVK